MRVDPEAIPGVRVFDLRVHADDRGQFVESWRAERARAQGLPVFVQDNAALSRAGVLRGLHYQHPAGQAKLVTALVGEVFDVIVDVRVGSPTFARWAGCDLTAANGRQLFVPAGIAHGYVVRSEVALVAYKCTAYYSPPDERAILWSDPEIGIEWTATNPVVSQRDASAPLLRDIPRQHLPTPG
jgi:dTDP-4-dehydrorhamnose 3,5-epimerase